MQPHIELPINFNCNSWQHEEDRGSMTLGWGFTLSSIPSSQNQAGECPQHPQQQQVQNWEIKNSKDACNGNQQNCYGKEKKGGKKLKERVS